MGNPGNTIGTRRPRACIALALCLAAGAPAHARMAQDAPDMGQPRAQAQTPPSTLGQTPAEWADMLIAGAADAPALAHAAENLLQEGRLEANRAELERALGAPSLSRQGRSALTRGLASKPEAPAWVGGPLIGLAARVEPEAVPGVLAALSSVRTRESARALLGYTAPEFGPPVREAALAGLVRLTGRSDLGDAPAVWQAWLDGSAGLSESQWRQSLVEFLARRADQADAARRQAVDQLVESLRRLHLATPQDQRSALLGELLRGQGAEVRRLGFELALRELANNARLDGPVIDACLELLRSPDASLRAQAAALLARLAPANGQAGVIDALTLETDPLAAASLLEAAARTPSRRLVAPVLRWLEGPPAAARAAGEAAWAVYRVGLLQPGPDLERVLEAGRRLALREPSAGLCSLLAVAGTHADRQSVARCLTASDPALRLAAADALAPNAEFLPMLADAARQDPNLVETLARAMVLRGPTADDFALVVALARAAPEARRRSLEALARAMPATDLLRAADQTNDASARELALAAMTSEARILSERQSPEQARALALGLTRLARLRAQAGRHAEALAAINALPEIDRLGDASDLRQVRAGSLIALDRLDLAEQQEAGPDTWLDALESLVQAAHARRVADRIRAVFDGTLDQRQQARLDELAALINKRGSAAIDPDDPDAIPPE